jgi:ketosteroid isomerase-like protein
MPTLEERVQALEDEKAITRTMLQYAHAEDQVNPILFMDCFTEDGVWWSTVDGPWAGTGGSRHEGREALGRWHADSHARGAARLGPRGKGKHYLVSPDIRLDGDRATAESYHLSVAASPDGPKIGTMGRYLDVFVRCPDGRWRIRERQLVREGAGVEGMKRTTT